MVTGDSGRELNFRKDSSLKRKMNTSDAGCMDKNNKAASFPSLCQLQSETMLECWLSPGGQGLTGLACGRRAWVPSAKASVHEE